MDPATFDQDLAKLDAELRARREALDRKKKVEKELSDVRLRMEAVRERLAAAQELGANDLCEAATKLLASLIDEEVRLAALIGAKPAPPPPKPASPSAATVKQAPPRAAEPAPPRPSRAPATTAPVDPPSPSVAAEPAPEATPPPPPVASPSAETQKMPTPKAPEEDMAAAREVKASAEGLVEEVESSLKALAAEPTELRNTRFHIWSFRWRLLRERAEKELPSAMGILSWAYAQLMEARKSLPEVPFLRAFNPKERGDWPKELSEAEALLSKLRLKHRPPRTRAVEVFARRKEEQTKAVQRDQEAFDALNRLRAVPVNFCLPEDPEGVKAFREAARGCMQYVKRIAPDLRLTCGPYRDLVEGEEFEEIWTVDVKPATQEKRSAAEPQEARKTWTRRDLIGRMLRRMLAKKEIGGKHTEVHNLYQGLPDHVRGDAKEGVEMLIKEGILRRKPTTKDEHVSIEPAAVRIVEDLIEGRPLPPNIARWLDEAPVAR